MPYFFLALAIAAEVLGTLALTFSEQFTKLVPSVIVIVSYAAAFYMMSWAIKTLPIGIVYAIWSGVGIAAISAISHFAFGQKLDIPALIGIILIMAGIIVIQLFSQTTHP